MSDREPRLMIGMPVRNGERYIREALGSLLAQTYAQFTILIADNASTDATEAICREHAARDPRIRYHRHPRDIGAAENFNFVFRSTSGELFKWAAHDDVCEPGFLARCIERLDAEPRAVLCHSYTNLIDGAGAVFGRYEDLPPLAANRPSRRLRALFDMEYPCTVWGVMRRDAIARTRLYGSFLGSDWNFMAEMLLLGRIELVPEPLFSVRDHETGFSFGFQKTSKAERLAWFNPNKKEPGIKSAFTSTARFAEAILRHPLPMSERIACLAHLARRTGGKVTGKLRRAAAGPAPAARSPATPAPAGPIGPVGSAAGAGIGMGSAVAAGNGGGNGRGSAGARVEEVRS